MNFCRMRMITLPLQNKTEQRGCHEVFDFMAPFKAMNKELAQTQTRDAQRACAGMECKMQKNVRRKGNCHE